ncbi:hypothetical protein BDY19DRAFT_998058 [Irpex rosettiformis]|uniref:Uncharacterized protein n=1 Tax=Irpex rosettiformis TaxID=378272 RepID=A0ACB8TPP2_9APHY|nr:hypothetical protein BDY19DRAFT_998058 [Irpex rosettiformis]
MPDIFVYVAATALTPPLQSPPPSTLSQAQPTPISTPTPPPQSSVPLPQTLPVLPPPLPLPPNPTQAAFRIQHERRGPAPSTSGPRHISQMPDAFHPRHDAAQALAARKREITAEKAHAQLQLESEITVTIDIEPKTYLLQEGFTFPNFHCDAEMLSILGLTNDKAPEGKLEQFQVYRASSRLWQQVRQNHCFQVKQGEHLFFAAKNLEPTDMKSLQAKLLSLHAHGDELIHFRKNLTGERESVRMQHRDGKTKRTTNKSAMPVPLSSPMPVPSSSPVPVPPSPAMPVLPSSAVPVPPLSSKLDPDFISRTFWLKELSPDIVLWGSSNQDEDYSQHKRACTTTKTGLGSRCRAS